MSRYEHPVEKYMTSPVHTVTVDDSLTDVQRQLTEHRVSSVVAVGKDGKAAGVVSYTDLLQLGHIFAVTMGERGVLELPSMCVGDILKTRPITVTAAAPLTEAAHRMHDRKIQRLFVLQDDRPVGVLSTRDLIRAVIDAEEARPLEHFMISPVPLLGADATLSQAVNLLVEHKGTGVFLTENATPVGMFTQAEALAARDQPRETPVGRAAGYSMLCLPGALPLHRAGQFALATRARRVLVYDAGVARGVLSGLEFARALLATG